eukprot:170058-Chlamydomonas_euryale.AAC.1
MTHKVRWRGHAEGGFACAGRACNEGGGKVRWRGHAGGGLLVRGEHATRVVARCDDEGTQKGGGARAGRARNDGGGKLRGRGLVGVWGQRVWRVTWLVWGEQDQGLGFRVMGFGGLGAQDACDGGLPRDLPIHERREENEVGI